MAKTTYYDEAKTRHTETLSGWETNNAFGVENQVSEGSISSSVDEVFGVSSLISAGSNVRSASSEYSGVWSGVSGSWKNVGDDSEGWENLGDAASSAALNYVNNLLEKLKEAWNTTTTVSIASLVGEISPYCVNIKETGRLLSSKVQNLLSDSLLTEINNLGDAFLNDPAITSAVANLKIVQAFASTINGVASTIDITKKILTAVEPFLPWLEIISNLALIFWSGGATASEATSQIQKYMASMIQELGVRIFEVFRRLIFNIKFKVPSLLVTTLSSLKFNEATDISEEYQSSLDSLYGTKVTATSNLLMGKTFNNFKSTRNSGENNTSRQIWESSKNTLSTTSDTLKTYGNILSSGNLLSSFKITKEDNRDWNTTSASNYFSNWTNPTKSTISDIETDWSKYTKENIKNTMSAYIARAQSVAHIWTPESYSTGGSSQEENATREKNTVVPEVVSLLDEYGIMKESGKLIALLQ